MGVGPGIAEKTAPEWHHFFRLGHMGRFNAQVISVLWLLLRQAVGLPHCPGRTLKVSELIAARA
ncbi:MAG: hypothetical protein OXH79_09265 [Boseongicola sp.]|nr:hypothetical protein [Boseongicola sp.]